MLTPKQKSYIVAALRRIWRWSAERKAVRAEAYDPKTKKFKCAGCSNFFTKKNTAVDHISPVVDPRTGFSGWDEYVRRLFCGRTGLQILCRTCHKAKTQTERAIRKAA